MRDITAAMGFLDKLKEKSSGVMTAAKPDDGVEPQPAAEVRSRLLAIIGKGIETAEQDDGTIVVAWAAQIASAGPGGAGAAPRSPGGTMRTSSSWSSSTSKPRSLPRT